MAQTIVENIVISDQITETLTYGSISQQVQGTIGAAVPTNLYSWINGTDASQVNLRIEHTYTLAAGDSTTLTLSSLTDDLLRSVVFFRVRKLVIYVTSKTGDDYLTVGNAASNPWLAFLGGTTPTYRVYDLDMKVAANTLGFPVTAGVSDQLRVSNSGSAAITFQVALSGTTEPVTSDRAPSIWVQPRREIRYSPGTSSVVPVSTSPESTTLDRWVALTVQPKRNIRYAVGTASVVPVSTAP